MTVRTIGKAAREAGVNVETVRYYERKGLIDQPPRIGGPRHYDDATVATLKYIRVAQGFGLTLREIKSLRSELGKGPGFCASLRSLVEAKLDDIARKQAELAALDNELGVFLANCRARAAHRPCPVVQELSSLNLAIAGKRKKGPGLMAKIWKRAEHDMRAHDASLIHRLTGLCGLVGGLLFFAGDMLMYGHWGAAVDFAAGALATLQHISLTQLYLGGLIGPIAAFLCALGFWHVYRNVNSTIVGCVILALSSASMFMLGAVHVLWVAKGLARRECGDPSGPCSILTSQLNDYWNTAYYLGVVPAYLACAILALAILAGRSRYPRWTVIFNPALSLLATPMLAFVPSPLGAPLVGGDANLFIAIFFAVSLATTWSNGTKTSF